MDALEGCSDPNFLSWLTSAIKGDGAIPPPPSAPPTAAPAPDPEELKLQLEFMFRIADTNDDGIISLREFQAILR